MPFDAGDLEDSRKIGRALQVALVEGKLSPGRVRQQLQFEEDARRESPGWIIEDGEGTQGSGMFPRAAYTRTLVSRKVEHAADYFDA